MCVLLNICQSMCGVYHWKLLYVSFVNYSKQRNHGCQLQLVATAHSSNVYGVYGIYQGTGLLLIFTCIILPTESVFFPYFETCYSTEKQNIGKSWGNIILYHPGNTFSIFLRVSFVSFLNRLSFFQTMGGLNEKPLAPSGLNHPSGLHPIATRERQTAIDRLISSVSQQYHRCRAWKNGNLP